MPSYKIRDEDQYSHVEYSTSFEGTSTQETQEILSETILSYASLTGTLTPGVVLTEADSGAEGKILWAKGDSTSGKIGLGEVTDTFEGGKAITGTDIACTGGAVENPLERITDTPDFEIYSRLEAFNTSWTENTYLHYLDVRAAQKLFVMNVGIGGYIRACARTVDAPLSLWIGPGKTVEILCDHRIFRLLIVTSRPATVIDDIAYSIGVAGETPAFFRSSTPRGFVRPRRRALVSPQCLLTPPDQPVFFEASKSVEPLLSGQTKPPDLPRVIEPLPQKKTRTRRSVKRKPKEKQKDK